MRIGILTQYYPPEMGAPQARLSNLAGHLASHGHDVYILTAMPNYPQGRIYPGYGGVLRREKRGSVTVIRTHIFAASGLGTRRLLNYFSFVFSSAVAGAFTLPHLDYLITESPPLFLGMSGYVLSRLKRAKWILNISDLWLESAIQLGVLKEGRIQRAVQRMETFFYHKAWCVSGQSKEILESILSRHPKTSTYHLSNGVAVEDYGPELASPEAKTTLAPEGSVVALYAGLHGYAQGLQQVLEAAVQLKAHTNLYIVFIGDGPEKQALMKSADDKGLSNVRFLDPVAREKIPALLASADIALIPLKERIFGAVPSKLYEAMGAGVPVVLMTGGEAEDIVRDSGAGLVVAPGDIGSLASAIRELAENPEERRKMGSQGRKAAVERFDRKAIADRFAAYLEGRQS